jgi:hypothetical protein
MRVHSASILMWRCVLKYKVKIQRDAQGKNTERCARLILLVSRSLDRAEGG